MVRQNISASQGDYSDQCGIYSALNAMTHIAFEAKINTPQKKEFKKKLIDTLTKEFPLVTPRNGMSPKEMRIAIKLSVNFTNKELNTRLRYVTPRLGSENKEKKLIDRIIDTLSKEGVVIIGLENPPHYTTVVRATDKTFMLSDSTQRKQIMKDDIISKKVIIDFNVHIVKDTKDEVKKVDKKKVKKAIEKKVDKKKVEKKKSNKKSNNNGVRKVRKMGKS
ncbi:phenylpyruvate tautomerase [Acrasis kona]|uniref:Phenylpyruvate tautomerase n=1 Tax=Acrasis kona TaxID=1008807 RepID=A0AAW2Z4F4_9EUKA